MPCNYLVPHVLFSGQVSGPVLGDWVHIGENKSVTLYVYSKSLTIPSSVVLGLWYSPLPPVGKRVFPDLGGYTLDVDSAAIKPNVSINVATATSWQGMALVDDFYNDQPYDFISMRIEVVTVAAPAELIVIAVTSSR